MTEKNRTRQEQDAQLQANYPHLVQKPSQQSSVAGCGAEEADSAEACKKHRPKSCRICVYLAENDNINSDIAGYCMTQFTDRGEPIAIHEDEVYERPLECGSYTRKIKGVPLKTQLMLMLHYQQCERDRARDQRDQRQEELHAGREKMVVDMTRSLVRMTLALLAATVVVIALTLPLTVSEMTHLLKDEPAGHPAAQTTAATAPATAPSAPVAKQAPEAGADIAAHTD